MKMNKLYKILTVSLLLSSFLISCSDTVNNQEVSQEKSCKVSGSLSFGDALPQALVSQLSASSSNRSAGSSFTTNSGTADDFKITAECDGTTVTGSVDWQGINSSTYELVLYAPGTWTITAQQWGYVYGSTSSSVAIMSGTTEVTVDDSFEDFTETILLEPTFNYGSPVTGSIDLAISSTASGVTQVQWEWNEESTIPAYAAASITTLYNNLSDYTTQTLSEGSTSFEFTDVPPGSHEVTISFLDADGTVLYSCIESITVFSGYVTDSWYGNSPYLSKSDGTYTFCLTDDVLATYTQAADYAITDTDTPYVLWSEQESISSTITVEPGLGNENSNTKSYITGSQVFNSVSGGESIATSQFAAGNVYCFGGGYLYVATEDGISRYRESYCSYALDTTFGTNGFYDLLSEASSTYEYQSTGSSFFDYYDGCIYLSWYGVNSNYSYTYHLTRYDVSEDSCLTADLGEISYNLFRVTSVNGALYVFYSVENTLYMNTLTVDESASTLTLGTASAALPVTSDNLGGFYGDLVLNDLLIQDSVLYGLVYCHANTSIYTRTETTDGNGNASTTYNKQSVFAMSGGVIKFNVADSVTDYCLAPVQWTDGSYILGLFTETLDESTNYYQDNQGTALGESKIVSMPNSDDYFYGAKKFAAVKDGKLVIADDGAYIELTAYTESSYEYAITPKKRVVTVNLTDESLDSVDVDVSFSFYCDGSGSLDFTN